MEIQSFPINSNVAITAPLHSPVHTSKYTYRMLEGELRMQKIHAFVILQYLVMLQFTKVAPKGIPTRGSGSPKTSELSRLLNLSIFCQYWDGHRDEKHCFLYSCFFLRSKGDTHGSVFAFIPPAPTPEK